MSSLLCAVCYFMLDTLSTVLGTYGLGPNVSQKPAIFPIHFWVANGILRLLCKCASNTILYFGIEFNGSIAGPKPTRKNCHKIVQ